IDGAPTAVYSITYPDLTDAGFTDPANVSVWGYGGCADVKTVGRPMAQVPALHRNGHIYFYGLGPEQIKVTSTQTTRIRNPYAAAGSYFLTDTATPTAPAASTASVADNTVVQTTHTAAMLWEREDTCPALGGTEWFTHNVMAWNGETVDFDLSSVADATISLYMRYAMYSTRSNSVILTPDQPNLSRLSTSPVRATTIGSRKGNVFTRGYTTTRYTASPLPADGTLSFTPSVEYPEAADYALIDYATLTYKRHNDLNGLTSRTMYFNDGSSGPLAASFTGVSATTEIWDITNPIQPQALILTDDGKTVIPRNGTTATLVAFDTSKPQRSVRFRGISSIDDILTETTGADMIIIAATPLMEAACELAGIHEQLQGMKVTVCDQQSIFNAYSSGTPHPESIRRYVTDATQANSNLRYLLIYGAANFNNRIVLGEDSPYVLTYQCESETYSNNTQYAFMSDDFYAITDSRNPIDGSSALLKKATLAVGRITVYGTS
ncbi:MAG: hypothetical protein K2M76_02950, partial [Muribaculaceae bacterium]|nr:hypothetical protein [Muribaculaceae bacterium]